jgi:hypothetical protein
MVGFILSSPCQPLGATAAVVAQMATYSRRGGYGPRGAGGYGPRGAGGYGPRGAGRSVDA